ncbi:hypothetical protein Dsin_026194 [Dipteronia sinensis]|uniref:Uncharacterized protein n=1 Tax=Dipteronia sinensis TaxID=43782 RepID=A0AAE0DZ17_9ROSI|nr:hypothetical protein Dsin_026194 [Dipteronia sinensis]
MGLALPISLGHAPVVPHTGEVMGTPVEFNNGNQQLYHPSGRSSPHDSRTSSSHGLDVQGNALQDHVPHMHGNNAEEEMIQAALEASKRDAEEGHLNTLLEDDELSHAVSLSLKTAEQENAMREQAMRNLDQQLGILNEVDHFQHNTDALPSNEWGGISSTELDEAIMLEAALFGEKAEGTSPDLSMNLISKVVQTEVWVQVLGLYPMHHLLLYHNNGYYENNRTMSMLHLCWLTKKKKQLL